jgi:hypothetical protein
MKKNNRNNFIQEDEVNVKELLNLLTNSKKIIIIITLIITTLGAIYSFQRTPEYESTALIEIGSYGTFESNHMEIEPAKTLIQELTINFIYKRAFEYLKIESALFPTGQATKLAIDRLILISHTSSSTVTSHNLLDEIIEFIENRHSKLQQKIKKQLTSEIQNIDSEIELINTTTFTQNGQNALRTSDLIPFRLFELSQEKTSLEFELKSITEKNFTQTQLIGKMLTKDVLIKKEIIIFLSFILGLFLSIIIVFINKSLKDFKEE